MLREVTRRFIAGKKTCDRLRRDGQQQREQDNHSMTIIFCLLLFRAVGSRVVVAFSFDSDPLNDSTGSTSVRTQSGFDRDSGVFGNAFQFALDTVVELSADAQLSFSQSLSICAW